MLLYECSQINEYEKTIVDYKCDENNITEESKNLILRNLRKIVLEEDKAKKILNFLDSHDGNKDTILLLPYQIN